MNSRRSRMVRVLATLAGIAALVLSSGCASHTQVIRVKSKEPNCVVKEVRVTGRPIPATQDSDPSLRIDTFHRPSGDLISIDTPVSWKILRQKLDPGKTYSFLLSTTEWTRPGVEWIRNQDATLIEVEDGGSSILGPPVCDVHHRPMMLAEAMSINYGFDSEKGNRVLEAFPNHGYSISGCCSGGGPSKNWIWRCPQCAKKVAKFWETIP